jgi:hypothetical protein
MSVNTSYTLVLSEEANSLSIKGSGADVIPELSDAASCTTPEQVLAF